MKYIQYYENYNSNFQKWFGDSVMEINGKPIVFYHGTKNKFNEFDKSKIGSSNDPGWLGSGFYFYDNYEDAAQYGKVNSYYLHIENPYFATKEDNDYLAEMNNMEISKNFTQELISQGYDGVYFNGNLRGETVVFEPDQIWKIDLEN